MIVGDNTIEHVVRVMRKHCTERQMEKIIEDLMEVPGDKAFRENVTRLVNEYQLTN